MSKYQKTIDAESSYMRAAAEWVAQYNRSPKNGVTVNIGDGEINSMCDAKYITGVKFGIVGSYYYSEYTYDHGSAGVSYTLWEKRMRKIKGTSEKQEVLIPCTMEIRWYDDMTAGKFIEECVEILTGMKIDMKEAIDANISSL